MATKGITDSVRSRSRGRQTADKLCRLLLTAAALLSTTSGCTAAGQPLPPAVDNSQSKYFPPLMMQGRVASCDWFAVVYYQMTYMENRQHDRAADPTNTFSPKFGFTLVNCGSTWPTNLWFPDVYELLKRHGSPSIVDVPYDLAEGGHYREWCTNAAIWQKALEHRIAGGEALHFDLDRLRHLLASGEVLVIQCMPWECDLVSAGNNLSTTNDDPLVGEAVIVSGRNSPDHTMAVVGYDDRIWADANWNGKVDSDELGAFKIAESAGGHGLNNGYRWIAYRAVSNRTNTMVFEDKYWRLRLRQDYRPKMIARVTLNHSQRDKLRMQFGRAATADAAAALNSKIVFDPYAVGFTPGLSGRSLIAGGNCAFDGGQDAGDGSFAFDLTDLLTQEAAGADYWYLRLSNKSDAPVQIKKFEIVDLNTKTVVQDTNLPAWFANGEQFRFVRMARKAKAQ